MSNETTPERPGDALVPVTVSPTLDLNEVPADALNGLQKMTPKKVPLPSAKPNSTIRRYSAVTKLKDNVVLPFLFSHGKPFWDFVNSIPFLRRFISRQVINTAVSKTFYRPYPLSTRADYSSWESLTDRRFSARHLPPEPGTKHPDIDKVASLFARRQFTKCKKSTLVFSYFAQWFTDGFLRTDLSDCLKNTSNHEIDLSSFYGVTKAITQQLRSFRNGKLKCQILQHGETYPPYLFDRTGMWPVTQIPIHPKVMGLDPEKKRQLFAMGGDRSNVHIGFVMMNVLCLREHNRLCDVIQAAYPGWDDERIFQTVRNILTVMIMKIVIEEYINHISPYHFRLITDPSAFWRAPWYRENWMSIEFNLLYRWHGLVPDTITVAGRTRPITDTMWNTDLIVENGLGPMFAEASAEPAGQIGIGNTTSFLLDTEKASIELGRKARLRPYNDYREMCGFGRARTFADITRDPARQKALQALYHTPDDVEYYVGINAEDCRQNSPLPPVLARLVAADAFSQALTNPLLAELIYKESTFTREGLREIDRTSCLSDLVNRNSDKTTYSVSMTRRDAS
jgi:prostaglandin-endoperoxide synthase 2